MNGHNGDEHLGKFYKTALRNPALMALLRRAGIPELGDETRLAALRDALVQARDQENPDWAEIGRPFAELLDTIQLSHPKPNAVSVARTAAEGGGDRQDHPHLRQAPAALVCPQRLPPDLRRVQPDRRSGFSRARADHGADRPERAQLQEFDADVQSRARIHCALGDRRRSSTRRGRASPSRCGSRCRSAIARPTTTLSSSKRC